MEKDKASKRTREESDYRDPRDKDSKCTRSSREKRNRDSDSHHRDPHHHPDRSGKDSSKLEHKARREHDRERLYDSRDDREGRRDRERDLEGEVKSERSNAPPKEREESRHREVRRETSYDRHGGRYSDGEYRSEREESVERKSGRRHSSNKRKVREERGEKSDRDDKRVRVWEERRRFNDDKQSSGGVEEGREFQDSDNKEDDDDDCGKQLNVNEVEVKEQVHDGRVEDIRGAGTTNGNASFGNVVDPNSPAMFGGTVPETSMFTGLPLPSKVSSIYTTNENKGVSITRSHEVTGKSSTDWSKPAAGKSGSLSLDALAKAKKALQMQKELSEKLKKIPQLKKSTSSVLNLSPRTVSKEENKVPPAGGSTPATFPSTVTAANISSASSTSPTSQPIPPPVNLASGPALEAVRKAQDLAAKMGFRQDPQFAPLINLFPGQQLRDLVVPQRPTKAPVLRLDALGREIDEHGNVINVTKPSNLSTLKVNINKQKKDGFQILKPQLDVDPESNPYFDASMGINKTKLLRPKRLSFQFVDEGKWSKEAETIKLKNKFGDAQAKEHKAKLAQLAKAKAAPDINPNLIEITERVITKEKPKEQIPEVEWWDVPLLQGGKYGDIADGVIAEDKLKIGKITIYVEHPRPIEAPADSAPPPPQPLKLTKKEQKKLRTQRRLAREKDRQEMIRQGLLEPPKPKVKISNLMKVLGSEATQDPTRLEKEIRSAAAEREQAHVDRNTARKLTPAERREKKERKLFDDLNTLETIVSVYKINDLSHPKIRYKVDINAQENRLTGCAVISDGISVVAVEGGSKSIKRYAKLMLKRIKWGEAVKNEDEDADEDKPPNKCVLVWQGSVAKPNFNRFSFHECVTEAAARKVFADAGVGHYWDLSVNFSDDQI